MTVTLLPSADAFNITSANVLGMFLLEVLLDRDVYAMNA